MPLVHLLGTCGGWLVYFASPRYRKYLNENLRSAGYADRATLHRTIAESGKAALELPYMWLRPTERTLALIKCVSGESLVQAARARGRGIVFLTPHLGCFEICAQWCAARTPITVLYRPPKQARLEPIMRAGRERPNITLAATDLAGVRKLLRALKRHEAAGILPDQVPSFGEGEWAEFFGRPAYTMTLVPRLLESTHAELILIYAERLPRGAGFHLHLLAPPGRAADETAARFTNRAVEAMVRALPSQYLWAYNRHKTPAGATPP